MPSAAPHTCPGPGCPALVPHGERACPAHKRQQQQRQAERRGTSSERGYDSDWYAFLDAYKRGSGLNPMSADFLDDLAERHQCAVCGARSSLEYDHIVPLDQGGPRLDASNIQPLCRLHHARKTARDKTRVA